MSNKVKKEKEKLIPESNVTLDQKLLLIDQAFQTWYFEKLQYSKLQAFNNAHKLVVGIYI